MIRRLLYLLLVLLCLQTAHADTYPATSSSTCNGKPYSGCTLSFIESFPPGQIPYSNETRSPSVQGGACGFTLPAYPHMSFYAVCSPVNSYTCPYGGTVAGSSCINAPECTAPQVRNATTGACEDPPNRCPAKSGGFGWMASPVSGPSLESQTYCDNGCMVGLNAPTVANNPGFSYTNGQQRLQKYEIVYPGASCTGGTPLPSTTEPAKTPPEPPKRPNCAPNEGVLTSSTGQVHCVPEGTPASKPPIVTKEQQTKTNADGTTTTTETTTTRDSQTGAEEKKSTSTTKDGNGNVLSQTSDTTSKGTTTGGNPDKPGDSDFCQKNPTLDICTGKLNKEETQKKIADDIKSLTDPGTTSTDPLKHATHTTESENQLKTENDKFTDAAKGITDPTASSKSSWQQAMESGWFSAIPNSGCTPITGTVGGRQFAIDHCEKASQISDIMSYALWFMLVVGSFVMFTGGQVRTQ